LTGNSLPRERALSGERICGAPVTLLIRSPDSNWMKWEKQVLFTKQ